MNRTKLIVIAAAILALFGGASLVLANPTFIGPTVQTANATTTPAYMTPGTATTTLVYNSRNDTTNPVTGPTKSNSVKADSVTFLIALTGSSTLSTAKVTFEYSNDGIDWYQNYLPLFGFSTSTVSTVFQNPIAFTFPFASTTVGGAAGAATIDRIAVTVPVPVNDVRAVVTLTGANAAVFAQFVPIKQNN